MRVRENTHTHTHTQNTEHAHTHTHRIQSMHTHTHTEHGPGTALVLGNRNHCSAGAAGCSRPECDAAAKNAPQNADVTVAIGGGHPLQKKLNKNQILVQPPQPQYEVLLILPTVLPQCSIGRWSLHVHILVMVSRLFMQSLCII